MCSAIPLCHPENIRFKDGRIVKADIIEKTDEYIKVEIYGVPVIYYFDEIKDINGIPPYLKQQTEKTSNFTPPIERINEQLRNLGYPISTWPAIRNEIVDLLTKIDFPKLKQRAASLSNQSQFESLISDIGKLLKQEKYYDIESPVPLVKLLINDLGNDDIIKIIDSINMPLEKKKEIKETILRCSVLSQIGAIILDLLDINVKVLISKNHVFNATPYRGPVFFADFTLQIFGEIDIGKYYDIKGKYWILKEAYRIPADRISAIKEQLKKGLQTKTEEVLNCYYPYILMGDKYGATSSIYFNRGIVYFRKGDLKQAITEYNKSIQVNPYHANVYYNRACAYSDLGDHNQAIIDYNKALENNPDYAEAYNNRAVEYLYQKDYRRAQEDVYKAQALGSKIHPELLEEISRGLKNSK